jgi:hypothetical protein
VSTVDAGYIAPWSAEAEDLIRGALRHVYTVKIFPETTGTPVPLPVTVTSCSLTYDEFWSPYVQGTLTAVVPDSATLAALDPRKLVRVEVSAGYVLPGAVTDSHLMCRCLLSRRSVDYPGNEMTLDFQGPEYVVEGTTTTADGGGPQALAAGGSWNSNTTVAEAMAAIFDTINLGSILSFTSFDPDADGTGGRAQWIDPGQVWAGASGENHLDIARDIADRNDAWVRVDEFGVFKTTRRRWEGTATAHRMRVGADGTVITSSDTLARDDWANAAYVRYEWTVKTTSAGVETETPKSASAWCFSSGAYDPDLVGMVTVMETRQNHVATKQTAAYAAESLLKRRATRSNALTVSGVAAYWVRPEMTLAVLLPVGAEQFLVASQVVFDLDAGRMDIRTRHREPGPVRAL